MLAKTQVTQQKTDAEARSPIYSQVRVKENKIEKQTQQMNTTFQKKKAKQNQPKLKLVCWKLIFIVFIVEMFQSNFMFVVAWLDTKSYFFDQLLALKAKL